MDSVLYDYSAMHGIAAQISQRGAVAAGLLASAQSNEAAMMSHFTGSASETARTCLATYKQAQEEIIEIITRGAKNYTMGTEAMAATEATQSAAFPG